MALEKSPGPDGFSSILYKRMPVLIRVLVVLFNAILIKGEQPKGVTRIYLAPLLKPGKDPSLGASRRPISLISTAAKILGGVLYHRTIARVEDPLSAQQYAYRGGARC